MPNYGDKSYWEERYKSPEYATFDWLENYSTLKDIIANLNINKESGRILNLGCGNSEFSENMYDDGYHNIKNIDISTNVINLMSERCKDRKEMTYEVMDVRDIKYESNTFDLAIDKSTIDALLCGEDAFINVAKMIKEVQRVLKVGGYYMIISYGAPNYRVCHLKRKFEKFKIEILKIEKDFVEDEGYDKHHYIYLCQKLEGADEVSKQFFDETIQELVEQQKMEEEEEKEPDENGNKDQINMDNKIENDNGELIQNKKDFNQNNLDTGIKIETNKKKKEKEKEDEKEEEIKINNKKKKGKKNKFGNNKKKHDEFSDDDEDYLPPKKKMNLHNIKFDIPPEEYQNYNKGKKNNDYGYNDFISEENMILEAMKLSLIEK